MTNGVTNTAVTGTNTGTANTGVGQPTGQESSLSNWVGPYVTDMLSKGQALAGTGYEAYTGPLTAGESDLQKQAFAGLAGLTLPTGTETSYTPGTFTAESAQSYMNPYLMAALQPQIDEARRQAEIERNRSAGRYAQAGGFGGGRQAIMEAELSRALTSNLAGITGKGYQTAYDKAMDQFNIEQKRQMDAARQAQTYGLEALAAQQRGGEAQRAIEQEGIAADLKQFEEERAFPYKQVQYMQSLLQSLPLAAQTYSYSEPSGLSNILEQTGALQKMYDLIFGPARTNTSNTSGTTNTSDTTGSSGTTGTGG